MYPARHLVLCLLANFGVRRISLRSRSRTRQRPSTAGCPNLNLHNAAALNWKPGWVEQICSVSPANVLQVFSLGIGVADLSTNETQLGFTLHAAFQLDDGNNEDDGDEN